MKGKIIKLDEDGFPKIKPSEQIAILWSYDPWGNYGVENDMVGSVPAHIGHLERHGAVYWSLIFKVLKETLDQFDFPICGYLYNSNSKFVEYRVRIIDIHPGAPKKWKQFIPIWRSDSASESVLYILIDQIDGLFPAREISEFALFTTGDVVKTPPHGNYLKIFDPLF